MNKSIYIKILIFLLILPFGILAQDININIDQIHEIKSLEVDVDIKCIAKDKNGYIWIGSDNGLYRFDGNKVERLNFKYVKNIQNTDDKLLVISDDGLFEIESNPYDYKVDTLIKSTSKQTSNALYFPKSLFQDKQGRIWIGEAQSIVLYNDEKFRRFKLNQKDYFGYLRLSYAFTQDGFERLWCVSLSGDLFYYDNNKETFTKVNLPTSISEVNTITALGDNRMWLGMNKGIVEITVDKDGNIINTVQKATIKRVSQIKTFKNTALVSTFENGLYQTDFNGNMNHFNNFLYPEILDIMVDERSIWCVTRESVVTINRSQFQIIPKTLNKFIPSLFLTKDNSIVFSDGWTVKHIFPQYDGTSQALIFDSNKDFWINDALLNKNNLWLSTSKGVYLFNIQTKQLKEIFAAKNQFLIHLFRDKKGTIWVCDKTEKAVISIDTTLQTKYWDVLKGSQFVIENDGKYYSGGLNGKLFFASKNKKFKAAELEFLLKDKLIIQAIAFSNDSIYLGTNQGIWTVPKLNLENAIPQLLIKGDIKNIHFDKKNNLWFCDTRGLAKWQNGEAYYFDCSNGLPSQYIADQGFIVDYNNDIWVATSKGIAKVAFNLIDTYKTPKPILGNLIINNKNRSITDFDLGTFQTNSSIGMTFSTLAYPASNIIYKSTLTLNDKVISTKTIDNFISFFGLKSGSYKLNIQAKVSGHGWSSSVIYRFNIENPWYRTAWFFFLIISLIGVLIYFLMQYYNRRLRQSNENLESLVKERTTVLEAQKNELIDNQKQIIEQQKELIDKNNVLSETQKALNTTTIQHLEFKEEQMHRELELKAKQLTAHALNLVQKNEYLLSLSSELQELSKNKDTKEIGKATKKLSLQIKNSIKQDDRWEEFRIYFEQVHKDFYAKLKVSYPQLTINDLKHCALVKLNMSLEDSATLVGVSSESVRISRYRIQKKMELSSQAAFYEYLVKL